MNGVTFAAGIVCAFLIGASLAWFSVRRTRKTLARITTTVSAMAAGDLDAHAPEKGGTGLAILGATVNRAGADFRSQIDQVREDRRIRDLILAAMDEGVLLIDEPGHVRYANPAALRLIGRIAGEHRGAPTAEHRPFVPPSLRNLVVTARESDSIREIEIEMGRPTRTVQAASVPAGGEGLALLILRDVTEARRVDAIRRDFVAAASHELKTPVASIQAAAETLSHALDEDPEVAHRFVAHLLRDSERLSRIVRDLLDLSRLETETTSFQEVRLDALAQEEIDRIGDRLRDADLAVDIQMTPVTVRGSGEDLGLLISNLLDNAVRYTRPGGRIRVEITQQNVDARLGVSDTGIGIPGRDLSRVFERFYRVDRARSRDTGGTGLGLAIVKHVAEQHGGRVEAHSELGRGSTFVVTLPA